MKFFKFLMIVFKYTFLWMKNSQQWASVVFNTDALMKLFTSYHNLFWFFSPSASNLSNLSLSLLRFLLWMLTFLLIWGNGSMPKSSWIWRNTRRLNANCTGCDVLSLLVCHCCQGIHVILFTRFQKSRTTSNNNHWLNVLENSSHCICAGIQGLADCFLC